MADIAYNHIGESLNYLSFGGMPVILQEHEMGGL